MRYLCGFLCVCALGMVPLVGCGEAQCQNAEDCDDQNVCTDDECHYTGRCHYFPVPDGRGCDFDDIQGVCVSGICEESPCARETCDDENECTTDHCILLTGRCANNWVTTGTPCDWDGVPGVCVDSVCGENLCEGVMCDDGDDCTHDYGCFFQDGSCVHSDISSTEPCDLDGLAGICIWGVCQEDPCETLVCDDGDLCTEGWCNFLYGTCSFNPRCSSYQCTVGSCDPADGSCTYTPAPDGTSCGICGERECVDGVCTCPPGHICFCIP